MQLKRNLILLLVFTYWSSISFAQTPSSGVITVGGDGSTWYPVTFTDDGWNHEIISTIDISRFNIHQDYHPVTNPEAIWKGSLIAQVKFHSVHYGNSSGFIDVDLKNYRNHPNGIFYPTGDFIAGWDQTSFGDADRKIVIWLKGNTTYNFKSNVTVSPTVYDGVSNSYPFTNNYGGPYNPKTSVEPYVNIYGRNEQTAFFSLDHPNYFKGSVGIGTSTPLNKLHVVGGHIAASSDAASSGFVQLWSENAILWKHGNGNGGLRFGPATDLNANNYSEKMRITDAGNVGIAMQNPQFPLDVNGIVRAPRIITSSVTAYHNDKFTYDNQDADHYGLRWTGDSWQPGGATAWLSGYGGIKFFTGGQLKMAMDISGNVGIGTKPQSDYKLAVEGTLAAKKIKVTQDTWPDYVFEPGYKLMPLESVESYFKLNKHLPEVPSSNKVKEEGLDIGDNQATLLKKIEELTIYIIEQNKRINLLEAKQRKH